MEYEIRRQYGIEDDMETLQSEKWIDDRNIIVYSRTYLDGEIEEQWIWVNDDLDLVEDIVHRNGEEESKSYYDYDDKGNLKSVKTYLCGELFDETLISKEFSTYITKTIRMGTEIDRNEITEDGDSVIEKTYDHGVLVETKVTKKFEGHETFEIFNEDNVRMKYGRSTFDKDVGVSTRIFHDDGELSHEYSSKLENGELVEEVSRDYDGEYESSWTYDVEKRESKEVINHHNMVYDDITFIQYNEKGGVISSHGIEYNVPFAFVNRTEKGLLPESALRI